MDFEPFPYEFETLTHMGVSKNNGTPKWMVYKGKPYENGWFGGTTVFGNTHNIEKDPLQVYGMNDFNNLAASELLESLYMINCT